MGYDNLELGCHGCAEEKTCTSQELNYESMKEKDLQQCPVLEQKELESKEEEKIFENKEEWEKINQNKNGDFTTHRMPVNGGWLVVVESVVPSKMPFLGIAMSYVPDPAHEWLEPSPITIDDINPVISDTPIEESGPKEE